MDTVDTSRSVFLNSSFNGIYPDYSHSIQPVVQTYYPFYYQFWANESNIEKAFNIAQKLIDKKLVTIVKVKDFVELVNEIASVI